MNTQTANGQDLGLTVVPEMAPGTVGLIVWWRLSGDVAHVTLEQAATAAGLPEEDRPRPVGDATALRRAVRDQTNQRRLVRPLGRQDGWALVEEEVQGDRLIHRQVLTAKLVDGLPQLETYHEGLRAAVNAAFERHLGINTTGDVSDWVVRQVERARAVRLRDTGGIYFVPRDAVPAWHRVTATLRGVTDHRLFEVPALQNDEAVEAILDAVEREAAQAVEELDAALAEAAAQAEGAPGPRSLRAKAERAGELAKKVGSYGELLGRAVDYMTERLGALQGSLVEAAMAAEAQKDAAR